MRIKSLLGLVTAGLLTSTVSAGVPIPTEEPDLILKTRAGTAENPVNRKVGFYFKTYTADQKVYIQWGDSTEAQEVTIAKANTLSSKIELKNILVPDMTVKIWAKDLNYFSCNSDSVYDIKIGPYGKKIREFRSEYNPFTNMSFLNDIDSLYYLVLNRNNHLAKLDLKNNHIQRLDLGTNNALVDLTLDCPLLYQIKISQGAALKAIDLSKVPAIQNLDAYQVGSLETLNLGPGKVLKKAMVTRTTEIKNLKIENYPVMTDLTLVGFENLENITLSNLPELINLNVSTTSIKNFTVPDLPKLEKFVFEFNKQLEWVKFRECGMKWLDLDDCEKLKEVDVSMLKSLSTIYVRNTQVEKIKYDAESWVKNLKTCYVTNNRLSFSAIPFCPDYYKPLTTNYYAPQPSPQLPNSVTTDDVIDLTAWATGDNGKSSAKTSFKWSTKFEEELVEGKDYSITDGKIKFLKAIDDSVCCELFNDAFPKFERTVNPKTGEVTDYRIITNYVKVNASQSGIEDVVGDIADEVKVQGRVFMAAGKKMVTVFDAQGRKVAAGNAVEVKSPGIYIAKCGKKAIKAVIK